MRAFSLFLIIAFQASAATYYIDFASGDDANNGTSTATPWKRFPGTTAAADYTSFFAGAGWAVVNGGDTIKLKSGTTFDSSIGGMIRMNSTYYSTAATVANPILIQRDTSWGSGAVTFDGTGMQAVGSGFGLFHCTIGGVTWDGVTTDGIVIQDTPWRGLSSYGASNLEGLSAYYVTFVNCGTSAPDSSTSASEGSVGLLDVTGGVFANCRINGDGNFMNGFAFGDTGKKCHNLVIRDTIITNHVCGDVGAGDWAIGIKMYSGSMTVSNCTMAYNFKGADTGHKLSSYSPTNKYIASLVYSNTEAGINANGGAVVGVSGTHTVYLINNVIHGNGIYGSYVYGGRLDLFYVGNTFHNNNLSNAFAGGNVIANNSSDGAEETVFYVRAYNNALYKPGGNSTRWNYQAQWWRINQNGAQLPSNLTLEFDWNSYVQTGSEPFAYIGSFAGSSEVGEFSYGANGPGHASGNWYDYYGGTAVAPTNGSLGHYHADVHSKGTGADDATPPPFTNPTSNDYTLTATYAGTNLTARSWYLPEMGYDKVGRTRVEWSIGAYEFAPASATTSSSRPSNRGLPKRR